MFSMDIDKRPSLYEVSGINSPISGGSDSPHRSRARDLAMLGIGLAVGLSVGAVYTLSPEHAQIVSTTISKIMEQAPDYARTGVFTGLGAIIYSVYRHESFQTTSRKALLTASIAISVVIASDAVHFLLK